ncbi:MAG: OmpA family protein [Pseudomonadota bacterium]
MSWIQAPDITARKEMDFRFSQFEILTAAGTLLICLYFICVFTEISAIEGELAEEIGGALEKEDLYWSGIEIDGQHIVVTGAVPDVPAQRSVMNRLESVFGIVEIDNQLQIIGQEGTCQKNVDEYLSQERVTFKSGSTKLTAGSHDLMGMLAMIIRQCSNSIGGLEVAGHTDSKGDAKVNLTLSQRRADVVARHLVQLGVPSGLVVAVGYGESQPVADNSTAEGRNKNRRIEFRVLGGQV